MEIIDRDRSGRERNGIIFRQIIGDNTGKRALVVADVHIVQSFAFAVCFKHLRVSEHLFGKPLLPLIIQAVEVEIGAASADDVPPGEGCYGVIVVIPCQEKSVRLGVLNNILRRGGLIAGEKLITVFRDTGGNLTSKGKHGGIGADKECESEKHALRCRAPELSEPTGQRVGAHKASECIGNVQELVVIVFVRLKYEQLAHNENKYRAGERHALLLRDSKESKRRQNEYEPNIFDPEPEPGLFSVIHPVDHDTDEVLISADGRKCPEKELRQRQQYRRKPKPEPTEKPFAGKPVTHSGIHEPACRHQAKGKVGMRVDHRQKAAENARREIQPRIAAKYRPEKQVQNSEQRCPAEERRPLRQQHVRNDVDPAHALFGEIRRRFVKRGEEIMQGVLTVEKIDHAEPAVEEEEKKSEHRRVLSPAKFPGKKPYAAEHLCKGKEHRDHIRPSKRRPKQIET